ncbi:hypothetical protein KC323_g4142 [Hortaea werneckii]|nr:hypothetical protein KC323_g4142 [Hortaea werneckii]
MENTNAALPSDAWVAWILVLIYSGICLAATILLSSMLIVNGERFNYVTLLSVVVSVTSAASIAQQIYYACHWRDVRTTALVQAKASIDTPSIAYGPLSTGFNLAMFEVQFVGYMINSILIMFWAISMAKGVYNMRFRALMGREQHLATAAKVLGVIIPGIFVGITFTDAVKGNEFAYMVITNILMIDALVIGSIMMIAISFRYVHSRHRFASLQNSSHASSSNPTPTTAQPAAAKIRIDKSLLLRFTIAFLIITAFEVSIISFEFMRRRNARELAQREEPDFSSASVINEILQFMPGVTAGLLCFLVFGTTAQFRKKYVEAFRSARYWKRARSSRDKNGSMEVWDTLASDHQKSKGYRCTVRGGASHGDDIELHGDPGPLNKKQASVQVRTHSQQSSTASWNLAPAANDVAAAQPQPWTSPWAQRS